MLALILLGLNKIETHYYAADHQHSMPGTESLQMPVSASHIGSLCQEKREPEWTTTA